MSKAMICLIEYCEECERWFVRCGRCGNNCCNAGTNDMDGAPCGCKEAYEIQTCLSEAIFYIAKHANARAKQDVMRAVATDGTVEGLPDASLFVGRPVISMKARHEPH